MYQLCLGLVALFYAAYALLLIMDAAHEGHQQNKHRYRHALVAAFGSLSYVALAGFVALNH